MQSYTLLPGVRSAEQSGVFLVFFSGKTYIGFCSLSQINYLNLHTKRASCFLKVRDGVVVQESDQEDLSSNPHSPSPTLQGRCEDNRGEESYTPLFVHWKKKGIKM